MSENLFGEDESVDSDAIEAEETVEVDAAESVENSAPTLPIIPPPLPVHAVPMGQDEGQKPGTILGIPTPLAIALGLGIVGVAAWYLSLPKKRTEDLDDVGNDDDDEDFDDEEEEEEDEEEGDEDVEEDTDYEDEDTDEEDADYDEEGDDEDLPDDGEDEEGE